MDSVWTCGCLATLGDYLFVAAQGGRRAAGTASASPPACPLSSMALRSVNPEQRQHLPRVGQEPGPGNTFTQPLN